MKSFTAYWPNAPNATLLLQGTQHHVHVATSCSFFKNSFHFKTTAATTVGYKFQRLYYHVT